MNKVITTISINAKVLEDSTHILAKLGMSRSFYIERVLRALIKKYSKEENNGVNKQEEED